MVNKLPEGLNIESLPIEVQTEARLASERIKLRLKRTAEDIVEIGKDLIAIKDNLPHGYFLPWVEGEFGMDRRTAANFMSVAERFDGKLENISNFGASVLYQLASPSTPDEVIDQVVDLANSGEKITVDDVKRLKAENLETALSPDEELMLKQCESNISEFQENVPAMGSIINSIGEIGDEKWILFFQKKYGLNQVEAELRLENFQANIEVLKETLVTTDIVQSS